MEITVVKPSIELFSSPEALQEQLVVVERAGRTCYKSEGRIGDGTAEKFIRSIIARGHESVIEHGNATVKFIGSRSMSHQLVRHRLCAFSQESQRYCDYGKKGLQVICPPELVLIFPGTYEDEGDWWSTEDEGDWWSTMVHDKKFQHRWEKESYLFLEACAKNYHSYGKAQARGVPLEDARCFLPNATKTEVVVTANWRQWRHMFKHRALNPRAQWEIRELMLEALKQLAAILPCIFGDLK